MICFVPVLNFTALDSVLTPGPIWLTGNDSKKASRQQPLLGASNIMEMGTSMQTHKLHITPFQFHHESFQSHPRLLPKATTTPGRVAIPDLGTEQRPGPNHPIVHIKMAYLNREDDDYHLNEVISNKYIPQRQPNPYLKKYYAGRRPLPWRSSKLSSWVTGNEWDLKDYEDWLWEETKKAKVKDQRRQERQRRRLQNTKNAGTEDDGDEDISRRSRKRVKLSPNSPTTSDVKTKAGNKSKTDTNTNTKPKQKRPNDPHLISAIKATSKRQGHLAFYTPCCCCYIYDRPRILKSQDFKRSLVMLLSEHSSEPTTRPKNPQSGRARFHEGRDKAMEQKRQRRPNECWGKAQWGFWFRFHDGHGGRGLRAWMREEKRKQAVPLGDPVEEMEGAEWFGLGDITPEGEEAPYRVRYIVARRSRAVKDGKRATLGPVEVVDEPFYWGRDMEDMEMDSGGESDDWVQEEWVCLTIDGGTHSEDDKTLSWIEMDDASEDDDF